VFRPNEENKVFIHRKVEDEWDSSNADAIVTYWEKKLGAAAAKQEPLP